MGMKRLIFILLFCMVLVPTSTAQYTAPAPAPSGSKVGLSLLVTNKDGKGLDSIRKDEIRVFENKTEQKILSIEADERPVDYVIVVDSTGSFVKLIQSAIDAAKLFIVNRRPQDQVAIVRFVNSYNIEKVIGFSTDGDALQDALEGLFVGEGQSALIDGLYLSAQFVSEHNNGNEDRRKALIVFTDGEERISYYKPQDLLKLLYQESVQMFAIGLTGELSPSKKSGKGSPRENAEKFLATVAGNSGGRAFIPETKEQLVASVAEILLHLRAQFRINYQSTNDASKTGFREVEVKFVSPDENRHLVTPRAYYVGPKTPPEKSEKKKKKL